MNDEITMRIPTNRIKPGMKVAEDIITPKGLVLVPNNNIVDEKTIFRMNLYQITSILVYIEKEEKDQLSDLVHVDVTQNFQEFKERYKIHLDLTREHLEAIVNKEKVQFDDLYQVASQLVDSLKTRSVLLNYMYSMNEEWEYTYTHCLNVSILSNVFARWLNLSEQEVKNVTVAGLLHDIGKLKINNEILNKPGRLTREEFEVMKKHSTYGFEMIKDQGFGDEIESAVLFHHEKLDGSGYPIGLRGDKIPSFAKIIGIVDIYDAMTSKRSYHKKYSPFKVLRMFEEESQGLIDSSLLYVLLENIAHHYLGEQVLLSNGEKGKISFIHNDSPSRPIVQVNGHVVDLSEKTDISITEMC